MWFEAAVVFYVKAIHHKPPSQATVGQFHKLYFLCAKGRYCNASLWWETCMGQAWWREGTKHNKYSFIREDGTILIAKVCFLDILSPLWVHAIWHCWWLLLFQLESIGVLCSSHYQGGAAVGWAVLHPYSDIMGLKKQKAQLEVFLLQLQTLRSASVASQLLSLSGGRLFLSWPCSHKLGNFPFSCMLNQQFFSVMLHSVDWCD